MIPKKKSVKPKPPKEEDNDDVIEKPFDDIIAALLRVPTKKRPKSSKGNSHSKK